MMVHGLKSLLTEKTLWRLLSKTLFGVLVLILVRLSGFNPFSVFFAAVFFAALFLREAEERSALKYSFFLLPLLFLLTAYFAPSGNGLALAGMVFALFLLLFMVFGLANLFFRERFLVYGILNTALLVSYFLLFFYHARGPENFWVLGPALFVATFFLLKEALFFFGFSGERRVALYAGTLGLVSLEFFHISQFLPFGFISSAAYLGLFLLLGKDLAVSAARGALNFSLIMRQITLFSVLTIVVFAASSW